MNSKQCVLRGNTIADVRRVVLTNGPNRERIEILGRTRNVARVDRAVLPDLIGHGEVQGDKRVDGPIKQPSGQAVVLTEGEPFDLACRFPSDLAYRTLLEDSQKQPFVLKGVLPAKS